MDQATEKDTGDPAVEDFQRVLRFLKALADETRLRLLGILSSRECSVEELAAMLGLKEPTVSHHLAVLSKLGLVGMRPEGNAHLYRLDSETLRGLAREVVNLDTVASLGGPASGGAWEDKVLRDFLEGTRLKEIPARRRKRLVILKWLAGKFEPGVRYPEARVNEVLKVHHPDFATLRRELVDNGFMRRENGVYWLVEEADGTGAGR